MRKYILSMALGILFLLFLAGCGPQAQNTPTATPTPTPSPTPTPTPLPSSVLEQSAQRMESLKSLAFSLEHLEGVTTLIPGLAMRKVDGRVALPDRFELTVDAEVTSFSAFVRIEVIVIGDEGYMTDPLSGQWRQVSPDALPFNFADLGNTLSGIVMTIKDPSFVDINEEVGIWRIRGTVNSDDLRTLVPAAASGLEVILEVWIDQDLALVRKAQIEGRVISTDSPSIVRLLTFNRFDEPVEISAPQ